MAAGEHPVAVPLSRQFLSVRVAAVELRLLVLNHELAVDKVLDCAVAVNLGLDRHLLVAVVGLGFRFVAVLRDQLAGQTRNPFC